MTFRPFSRYATSSQSSLVISGVVLTRRSMPFLHSLRSFHASGTVLSVSDHPTTHAKLSSPPNTPNFIDNQFLPSKASEWTELRDPATNYIVTRVLQSTDEELEAAVDSAEAASPEWRATSLLKRQQIIFNFVALILQHWDRLAASITHEQGKTLADAKGDVPRGIQVAETACGITTQLVENRTHIGLLLAKS